MISSSEKSNSLLIHLSAFANYIFPFGNILAPLIFWQSTKKDSDYIDHHGKEAVNFNLSFSLYNIIAVAFLLGSIFSTLFNTVQLDQTEEPKEVLGLLLSTGGFITALILLSTLGVLRIVFIIIAAIKANNGKLYRYPLIIRFIK